MPHPRFKIAKGEDQQYYYNLTAANAEVILTGEGYTTRERRGRHPGRQGQRDDRGALRAARVAGWAAVLRAQGGQRGDRGGQ
jgi:hypothetical protein